MPLSPRVNAFANMNPMINQPFEMPYAQDFNYNPINYQNIGNPINQFMPTNYPITFP